MSVFGDDDAPRKTPRHDIGQDLSQLSVEDIDARVALLKAEIERLEGARAQKLASRAAAASVFKV